ncbi:MAG: prephenate dehydrogenase [Dehalococcoidia bacterium]
MTRIAIIGLGLIGGSMGLALKKVADLELVGFARRPEVAAKALSIGAVDRAERNLLSAVEEADLVIIATPVVAIKEILAQIGERLSHGCIVTDTASTKAQVMGWAEEFLPSSVSFIGGHPMAGKEASGIEAADADLFTGCTYCLVPGRRANGEAINVVKGLVGQIGARPFFLDASEHDSLVAAISHLPLLLSAALVSTTARSPSWPQLAKLAATGFRDLTRLASGNPEMSRDICLTNREPILHWVDEYIKELGEFRRLVSEGGPEMEEAFIRAKEGRDRWWQELCQERSV